MHDNATNVAAPDEHALNASTNPITTLTKDSGLDGPCLPITIRHNGKVINDHMQPAAWKLVDFLWQHLDQAGTFTDLKEPVYGDREHSAGDAAFGALRRAANAFFKKHRLHWRVHIKKKVVYLRCSK